MSFKHGSIVFIFLALVGLACKDQVYIPVDLLTDPSVMPEVIYSYPRQNSTGPYDNFSATITLRFNKIMDITSLQRAIRVISPAGDVRSDTIRVSSAAGDVVSVTPITVNVNVPFMWKVDQVYTLRIDSDARDINGNALSHPFIMTLKPEPYFRVKSVSPVSGTINVGTGAQVRLQFNSFVDTTLFSGITFSPVVSGGWHYSTGTFVLDSSVIVFQPVGNRLSTGTTYALSLGSTAEDKNGYTLVGGFASTFATVPFAVSSTSPANGAADVSALNSVTISLNANVDSGTIRNAFTINPPVIGLIGFAPRTISSFTFSPIVSLIDGTTYSVTVDSSLLSVDGTHLVPYSFSFTVVPFNIGSTSPPDGATRISTRSGIFVTATNLIDTSTIRSAFSINPPVTGTFSIADPSGSFSFRPVPQLQPLTVYTVTISNGLRSRSGGQLQTAYEFTFATGN